MPSPAIIDDFALMHVVFISVDGKQHIVNPRHHKDPMTTVESIPWNEILGRTITSVSMDEGKIVLGLSTKK